MRGEGVNLYPQADLATKYFTRGEAVKLIWELLKGIARTFRPLQ